MNPFKISSVRQERVGNPSRLLFIVVLIWQVNFVLPQTYQLSIFGFNCGIVQMTQPAPDQMKFRTYSVGLIDYIWPFDNEYLTTYDSLSYGIRHYEKNIKQGGFRQKLKGEWRSDDSTLYYDDIKINRPDSCQTIFTMLARLRKQPADYLDTKWFPLEHEGRLYNSRLLRADPENISVNGDSVLCDNFRLDLKALEDGVQIAEHSDFFSKNITHPKAIRQLWVEQNNNRRIIKASVTMYGITVEAMIQP